MGPIFRNTAAREEITILQRMAERWLIAADEVAQPALKRCYRARAAIYERLATGRAMGSAGATRRHEK